MISPKDLASIRVRFAEEPHGTLRRYLGGCRGVPCRAGIAGEREQIRKHHADSILAVDRTAVADGALVPAGRTWTLLNELLEAGYTMTFLAKQQGSRAAPKGRRFRSRPTGSRLSPQER